ncbi:MAG: alkaline phosphatase [Candidatus Hydrogenedentota bacterium]
MNMSSRNSKTNGNKGMVRRDFLKASAAAAVLFGGGRQAAQAETTLLPNPSKGEARNVILLVSDGMSIGALTTADHMLRRHHDRASHWMKLYEEDHVKRGLMDMASANSMVTGSAAASCSWGSGQRINNGAVNTTPDGEELTPILQYCKDAGKGTGLVTTARLTHATPAGFGVSVPDRGMEDEIAEQYLERAYDVYLGGGVRHFEADQRGDGQDLFQAYRDAGYAVVSTRDGLLDLDASDERVLGAFYDSHLPYDLDRQNTSDLRREVPTLAEMTGSALDRLNRNGNGFLLQIEGARIDHAAHGNDAGGLIYDQIALDDAVGVALEFQKENPDTLVIVTTDHANASPSLNAAGAGYNDSNSSLDRIAEFTHTNNWIFSGLNSDSDVSAIKDRIEEATNIEVRDSEAEVLQSALRGEHTAVYSAMSSPVAVLGQIMANHIGVSWASTGHTSDYVELCATGPGSEAVGPFTRNTDLFNLMLDSMGVDYASARKAAPSYA